MRPMRQIIELWIQIYEHTQTRLGWPGFVFSKELSYIVGNRSGLLTLSRRSRGSTRKDAD